MNKKLWILLPSTFALISCVNQNQNLSSSIMKETSIATSIESQASKESEQNMKLYVDEQEIDVAWLDNPSVNALKELTKSPLTIDMHRFGGFEQVGSIGQSIISNDVQMNTNPGDIVLYDSSNIVIFFGTNSWSYTKLGHIDLSVDALKGLLDKPNVTLKIE